MGANLKLPKRRVGAGALACALVAARDNVFLQCGHSRLCLCLEFGCKCCVFVCVYSITDTVVVCGYAPLLGIGIRRRARGLPRRDSVGKEAWLERGEDARGDGDCVAVAALGEVERGERVGDAADVRGGHAQPRRDVRDAHGRARRQREQAHEHRARHLRQQPQQRERHPRHRRHQAPPHRAPQRQRQLQKTLLSRHSVGSKKNANVFMKSWLTFFGFFLLLELFFPVAFRDAQVRVHTFHLPNAF